MSLTEPSPGIGGSGTASHCSSPHPQVPFPRVESNVRPISIAAVYENQPIALDSTYAVPRVTAQLLSALAQQDDDARVVAASPGGKTFAAVECLDMTPSAARKLWCRIGNSRPVRRMTPSLRSRPTLARERVRSAFGQLRQSPNPPQVVLCCTFLPMVIGREYLPNSTFILWLHSLPRLGQEQEVLKAINSADVVVTASRAVYRELFQLYSRNCFAPPVWVIPYYQPEAGEPPLTSQQCAIEREELGIQPDEIAIVHVGRAPEKGLQIVEAALACTGIGENRVTLISVGGTTTGQRHLKNGVRVIERGRISQQKIHRLYQACQFGVIPSVWLEAFGLVVTEMMLHGLCPIASRVGGIPEIVDHLHDGLLVDDPNDVQQWSAAMEMVLHDVELRRRLGTQAVQKVHNRFSVDRFRQSWMKCLETHV